MSTISPIKNEARSSYIFPSKRHPNSTVIQLSGPQDLPILDLRPNFREGKSQYESITDSMRLPHRSLARRSNLRNIAPLKNSEVLPQPGINLSLNPLVLMPSTIDHSAFLIKSQKKSSEVNSQIGVQSIRNDILNSSIEFPTQIVKLPRRRAPIKPELLDESILRSSRISVIEDDQSTLRVQILLVENQKLKEKNSELLEINRKLVDEGKLLDRGEINSMYHVLFVEEHKKEIREYQFKGAQMRMKLNAKTEECQRLEKENRELKKTIETYRSMALDIQRENGKADLMKTELLNQEGSTLKADAAAYERIISSVRVFEKSQDAIVFLDSMVEELPKIFDCALARVVFFSPFLRTQAKKKSRYINDRFILGVNEYEGISRKDNHLVDESLVNNVDQLSSLKRFLNSGNQVLSVPVISLKGKEDFYCVLQVSEPHTHAKSTGQSSPGGAEKKKKKRPFNSKDEYLMQLIGRITSVCLDNDACKEKIKSLKKFHKNFTQAICEMAGNKNHQELLYFIKTKMPAYFKFESIGVLVYNKTEQSFLSYDTQKSSEGKFYSKYPLKYPTNIGVTGHIFEHDVDLMTLNEPRNNRHFQPEIDNTSNAPAVKNIMIALLKNEYNEKVGVLQLVNKKNEKKITAADEELTRLYQLLFGCLLVHSAKIEETINLTYNLKLTMMNLEKKLDLRT